MYNEFEIAYEAIAGGDAPGYEPYQVSIILTQAQDKILKALIGNGIESDDTKSLVFGPFTQTESYSGYSMSDMYPDTFVIEVDQTPYWSILNERLKQSAQGATIEVKSIDHATFAANVDNPYKKPDSTRYFWRFIEKGQVNSSWNIYGPTDIHTYYISYLDKPDPIIVPGVALSTVIDGITVDATIVSNGLECKFNSIIHRDIVLMAAKMAKAFIGDAQGLQLLSIN